MRRLLFALAILFGFSSLFAESEQSKKKTICLNMIVKDESAAIERCLGSLKHIIDYWVIVDTGSKDGTPDIIKEFMKDIPGELHERPWKNFAHNRNEALNLAKSKGDYLLFIDADEILEYTNQFALPVLDKDFYHMMVRQKEAVDVKRVALVNSRLDWRWEGILHEVLVCPRAQSFDVLEGVINLCNYGPLSGRSQMPMTEKYLKDALVLEQGLKDEPENSRYAYYLGQSYLAAEKYDLAIKSFEKRVTMASNDTEETYRSLFNIGLAYEKMGDLDAAIKAYFKSYQSRPWRAEPLFHSAVLYRQQGNLLLGYLLSKHALSMPCPTWEACIEYQAYDHAILIEFANCALLMGKYQEGLEASTKLLNNPNLSQEVKTQVLGNCEFARKQLIDLERNISVYKEEKIQEEQEVLP